MYESVEVGESNFEGEVLRSRLPVLADFYSPWSAPCRAMARMVEALAERYAGRVKVVRIDVDAAGELADLYRIGALPTLLMLDRGTADARIAVGFDPRADLPARLDAYLAGVDTARYRAFTGPKRAGNARGLE